MESIYQTQLFSSAPPNYVMPQPLSQMPQQPDHHHYHHHNHHSPYGYRANSFSEARPYHPDSYTTSPIAAPAVTSAPVPAAASAGWQISPHLGWNSSPPLPASRSFARPSTPSCFSPTSSPAAAQNAMTSSAVQRPKLTTTVWEDEGTLCYQVDAKSVCVARRQDNDMINGTKLLNVVGMSRGKRDGILKNEKGRVVVKVGAMHLKGVWITFQRAKDLASKFKITDLLYPLFVDSPSEFVVASSVAPTTSPSTGAGSNVTSMSTAPCRNMNQFAYRDYGAFMQSWERPYQTLPSISSNQEQNQMMMRSHPASVNDTNCSPIPGSIAPVMQSTASSHEEGDMYLLNHSYDCRSPMNNNRGYPMAATHGSYHGSIYAPSEAGQVDSTSPAAPQGSHVGLDHPFDHMSRKPLSCETAADGKNAQGVDFPHSPPPESATSVTGHSQLKMNYPTRPYASMQPPPPFGANGHAQWSPTLSTPSHDRVWADMNATKAAPGSNQTRTSLVTLPAPQELSEKKRKRSSHALEDEDEDEDEEEDVDDAADEDYCEDSFRSSAKNRKRAKNDK